MGPTFYQPTREPRNPDYSAPPKSPLGSALPVVKSLLEERRVTAAMRGASTEGLLDAAGSVEDAESLAGAGEGEASIMVTAELGGALSACKAAAYVGMTQQEIAARMYIAFRDTTLRMGSALFDEGRYAEALEYYKQANDKLPDQMGGDEAQLMMGKIYLFGLGEKSDPKEGVRWLKSAAGSRFNPTVHMPQFDPKEPHRNTATGEAAVILGNLYLKGAKGIPADPKEARKWFDRAREVGHVPAAKILGDLYSNGVGGPRDLSRALAFYKEAATLDYAPAQFALAQMYQVGEVIGGPNLKQAMAWYQQAAKQEHPAAAYMLARAYDRGEGAPADPEKAIAFYKMSALKGNLDAQAAMATYFYEGKLVPKDDVTARKWFENAAIGGDSDAMYSLGVMTMKGEGGDADLTKAWVWLKMSEKGGVKAAPNAVSVIEKRMTPQQLQAAKSIYNPAKS